jgi:hypothetical protein
VNDIIPTGNYLFRINDGVTADHVYTMSPTMLLDTRVGWQRFQEPNVRQHEGLADRRRSDSRRTSCRCSRAEVLPVDRHRQFFLDWRQPVRVDDAQHLFVPADL